MTERYNHDLESLKAFAKVVAASLEEKKPAQQSEKKSLSSKDSFKGLMQFIGFIWTILFFIGLTCGLVGLVVMIIRWMLEQLV